MSVAAEVAYIVASALFSAGLVSLLLSQVTLEESRLGLQATIESSIEASLLPLREVLQAGCQVDYRWHCLLSMPGGGDAHPEYSYQQITIQKDLSELPPDLRFVCVASMADDALSAFVDDPRYQFRWIVDENLDPNNRLLFDVSRVSVDGRELIGRDVGLKLKYSSRQVCYNIPRGDGGSRRHTISFDVLVRKHFGSDRRVR
ncbi:MAG: hypothetical protein M3437_13625, partial [Chloroflexota bacterium]|nr:hypothetical protein [Chloroflexota bacterium]